MPKTNEWKKCRALFWFAPLQRHRTRSPGRQGWGFCFEPNNPLEAPMARWPPCATEMKPPRPHGQLILRRTADTS